MPYKHGIVPGLGSRWADKGIVGALHSDVTVYKAETPSYNTAKWGKLHGKGCVTLLLLYTQLP